MEIDTSISDKMLIWQCLPSVFMYRYTFTLKSCLLFLYHTTSASHGHTMLCLWNKFLLQACWSRTLSCLGKGHFRLSLQNCLGKRGKKLKHYWAATAIAATAAAPTAAAPNTAHNGHPSSFQAPCAAEQPFVADIRFHLLTGWRNYWRNSAMWSAHQNRCFPCLLQMRSSIQCFGSMIFWGGSGSGSFYFRHLPSTCQQNLIYNTIFSAYYFLKVHLHHFSKKKSQKSHKI